MDKWNKRFMELTVHVASWSSCLRRKVGAVIVKDKHIMTTGYNGAPAGVKTCVEKGVCLRNEKNIPSGTHAEVCYAAHAEQNAIIQAAKEGEHVGRGIDRASGSRAAGGGKCQYETRKGGAYFGGRGYRAGDSDGL